MWNQYLVMICTSKRNDTFIIAGSYNMLLLLLSLWKYIITIHIIELNIFAKVTFILYIQIERNNLA